jgi:N-methylhydantoinase A
MAAALRIVSVERGHDPREFALVAFGGAGPVHAARLAQELEIPEVIVPPIPGGFSALGLVASDFRPRLRQDLLRAAGRGAARDMGAAVDQMEAAARGAARGRRAEERWELTRAADCRYGRQAYELTVPVAGRVRERPSRAWPPTSTTRHRQTYGHASPDEAVQCVNLRLAAVGHQAGLEITRRRDPSAAPRTVRHPRGLLQGDGAGPLRRARPRGAAAGHAARRPAHHRGRGHHHRRPAGLVLPRGRGGFIRLTQTPPETSR